MIKVFPDIKQAEIQARLVLRSQFIQTLYDAFDSSCGEHYDEAAGIIRGALCPADGFLFYVLYPAVDKQEMDCRLLTGRERSPFIQGPEHFDSVHQLIPCLNGIGPFRRGI